MSNVTKPRPFPSAVFAVATSLMFLSQAYLLPKVLGTNNGLDFRLVWLALRGNSLSGALGLIATMVMLRSGNLSGALGLANPGSMDAFAGSLIATIALGLGCISATLGILRFRCEKPTTL